MEINLRDGAQGREDHGIRRRSGLLLQGTKKPCINVARVPAEACFHGAHAHKTNNQRRKSTQDKLKENAKALKVIRQGDSIAADSSAEGSAGGAAISAPHTNTSAGDAPPQDPSLAADSAPSTPALEEDGPTPADS